MAKLLKARIGVSDDPTATQPTLNECLGATLERAPHLMAEIIIGLGASGKKAGNWLGTNLQQPQVRAAVDELAASSAEAGKTFHTELSALVFKGGGKDQVAGEVLRFDDLQMFEDDELDRNIEIARAQQEVSLAVDDVLPVLDALISTLMGWRTVQPGLNPLRPELFVRALQATLARHVPDKPVRETLITPAAGLMGVSLRALYREINEWLRSSGVEPAVPMGGRPAGGAKTSVVTDTVAKTLLTLDRLRNLLAGDFDRPKSTKGDFLHTVPASFVALQDLKQVDVLVERLQKRPKPAAAEPEPAAAAAPAAAGVSDVDEPTRRLGHQLGTEVVRLMFDNLAQDQRLLPAFRQQLRAMEPAVMSLAKLDSRFFSNRNHPARQLLDRMTQRSLAFKSESDEGWRRFLVSVEQAVAWLGSKVVDADTFDELNKALQEQWTGQDQGLRVRSAEAARALLHAEQRNLLAQKLAAEFAESVKGLEVADFVVDFLKGSWAQVVAESQLSCTDGSDDPHGYRALVEDLIWSVQRSSARRGRVRRLAEMMPRLLGSLREGLQRIDYPPELSQRFFDALISVHQSALQEGRDEAVRAAVEAAEAAAEAAHTEAAQTNEGDSMWLADQEAAESGYLPEDSVMPVDAVNDLPGAPELPGALDEPAPEPAAPLVIAELRTGTWVELMVNEQWTRVQLTWASPHATLFMFTSLAGTAHSMSRRTLDRLQGQGLIKVVADRHVVDEALDQVAQAALKNSRDKKGENQG